MHLKRKKSVILKTLILAGMLLFGFPASVNAEENLIPITEKEFPDDNFRLYVREKRDNDKDGFLDKYEMMSAREIIVSGMNIEDLTGIEYFVGMRYLECDNNKISEIDTSNNKYLRSLWCSSNQLKDLNVQENTCLKMLICNKNNLRSLDLQNNSVLYILECSDNKLTSLYLADKVHLYKVICPNNLLTSLEIRNTAGITDIDCSGNQLNSLNLSDQRNLVSLNCGANHINSLDLSSNRFIEKILCYENDISQLLLPRGELYVSTLNIYSNYITELDTSSMPGLKMLICDENCLVGLELENNSKLEMLSGGPQKVSIETAEDRVIDLSSVKGFDAGRISNLKNATLKDGKIYVISSPVSYDYELSDSEWLSVCIDTTVHTHSLSKVERTEATCGENGNLEYYTCTCGEWFWDSEGTKRIQDKQEVILKKTNKHQYDEGVNISESTCITHGTTIYTCTVCHREKIQSLSLKEHEEATEVIKATTQHNGYVICVCNNCGRKLDKTIIYSPASVKVKKGNPTYTGKPVRPKFYVENTKGHEISADYYEAKYPAAIKVGTYKARINFKKLYEGVLTVKYDVLPPKTTIIDTDAGKNKIMIRWKKQSSQVDGYELQYSTDRFFKKYIHTCRITSNHINKKTITGLKPQKVYYVRIRTYKKVGGKKYYSNWSNVSHMQVK